MSVCCGALFQEMSPLGKTASACAENEANVVFFLLDWSLLLAVPGRQCVPCGLLPRSAHKKQILCFVLNME